MSVARGRYLAGACAVGVLVAGSWWVGANLTSTATASRVQAGPRATAITATVVRKRLFSRITARGKVVLAGRYQVRLGTVEAPGAIPMVTQPGPPVGSVVRDGTVVADVAGQPIVAFQGAIPMYRMFAPGTSGPDVAQLQQDLATIGFTNDDERGSFGPETEKALAEFLRSAGLPVNTRPAMPGPRHRGRLRVTSQVVLPQANVVFVPHLPATVAKDAEHVGQTITNPALTLATSPPVVQVKLFGAQGSVVRRGLRASVTILETQHRETLVRGRILWANAKQAVIAPAHPVEAALAGKVARAVIVLQHSSGKVLAVPVSALFQEADGSEAVVVVRGRQQARVRVAPGISIGGEVAIRPLGASKLNPGDRVLVGE